MAKVGFAVPVLPGKEDLATKHSIEEIRRRMTEYEESRRRAGAPYDRWFKDGLKEFFPPFVDFDQPVPANETVWDWTRT